MKSLKLAILGTRGIPANYGGFETFAEELATRLVSRGHRVWVYGRRHYAAAGIKSYRGVGIISLPALQTKYLETPSHTVFSVTHALIRQYDLVLMCNAANAFLSWLPRLKGQKVVLNVDGIERLRKKWGLLGREFYRLNERLATIIPNVVVADARAIQEYYRDRYNCPTCFIPYGAPVEKLESTSILDRLGLTPGRYLLYVSRLEPENNAHLVIEAYLKSSLTIPLVIVGDAPYARKYISELRTMAERGNVQMPGPLYGLAYRELLSHCLCYLQATEVGGTHPALLEAMGAGALVLVNETPENREVVGDAGLICHFSERKVLAAMMRKAVDSADALQILRRRAQDRIREFYDWEQVTDQYEELFHDLVD